MKRNLFLNSSLVAILLALSGAAHAETGPKPSFQEKITTRNVAYPGYFGVGNHKNYDASLTYNDNVLVPDRRGPAPDQSSTGIDGVSNFLDEDFQQMDNWLGAEPNSYFVPGHQRVENTLNSTSNPLAPTDSMTPLRVVLGNFDSNPRMEIIASDRSVFRVMKNFDGQQATTQGGGVDTYSNYLDQKSEDFVKVCGNEAPYTQGAIYWTEKADINHDGKMDVIASITPAGRCMGHIGYWLGNGDDTFQDFTVMYVAAAPDHIFSSFVPRSKEGQYDLAMLYTIVKDGDTYVIFKPFVLNAQKIVYTPDIKNSTKLEGCIRPQQIIASQFTATIRNDFAVTCMAVRGDRVLAQANQVPQNALQLLQMQQSKTQNKSLTLNSLSSGTRITNSLMDQMGEIFVLHEKNLVQTISSARGPYGISSGDYNNDGQRDIAFAATLADALYILRNKGDGTFEELSDTDPIPTETKPRWVQTHDFNSDGLDDIALVTLSIQSDFLGTIQRVREFQAPTDNSIAFIDGNVQVLQNAMRDSEGVIRTISQVQSGSQISTLPSLQQRVYIAQYNPPVIATTQEAQQIMQTLNAPQPKSITLQEAPNSLQKAVEPTPVSSLRVYINEKVTGPSLSSNTVACESLGNNFEALLKANPGSENNPVSLNVDSVLPEAPITYNESKTEASVNFGDLNQNYKLKVTVTDSTGQSKSEELDYPFLDCKPINSQETSLACPSKRIHNMIEGDTIQICAPESFAGKNITWKQMTNTQHKFFDESNSAQSEGSNCIMLQSPVYDWNVDFTEESYDIQYEVDNVTQKLVCNDTVNVTLRQIQGGAGGGKCTLNRGSSDESSLWPWCLALGLFIMSYIRRRRQAW